MKRVFDAIRIMDTISFLLKFHEFFTIIMACNKSGQSSMYIAWGLVTWYDFIVRHLQERITWHSNKKICFFSGNLKLRRINYGIKPDWGGRWYKRHLLICLHLDINSLILFSMLRIIC